MQLLAVEYTVPADQSQPERQFLAAPDFIAAWKEAMLTEQFFAFIFKGAAANEGGMVNRTGQPVIPQAKIKKKIIPRSIRGIRNGSVEQNFLRGIGNRLRGTTFYSTVHYSTLFIMELQLDLRGIKMIVCGICFVSMELCGIGFW